MIAVTPLLMLQIGQPIDAVHNRLSLSLVPIGIYLILLALFPTDATAIRTPPGYQPNISVIYQRVADICFISHVSRLIRYQADNPADIRVT